jgi:hypothetical protein
VLSPEASFIVVEVGEASLHCDAAGEDGGLGKLPDSEKLWPN